MLCRIDRRYHPLARAVSALGVILVLILSVLAASPDLHERVHGLDPAHASSSSHAVPSGQVADQEDGCIVTLFSQGVVLPLALFLLVLCARTRFQRAFGAPERVVPDAPRYLRLPTQAPPVWAS
jgi:hypothetical protein